MIKSVQDSLEAGVPAEEVRLALFHGLDHQRRKLMTSEVPIPGFLVSLDVLYEGLKALLARAGASPSSGGISLVIGVVEGDPHDMGKNIVSRIYSASGYQVHDLGSQVPTEKFVDSVKEKNARVLALSAMMSTTMAQMPDIIRRVRAECPGTVIMVGGAPLDPELARSFGADGYAQSAVTVLEETEAAIERANPGE